MIKILHYIFGIVLTIFGVVLFVWFYGNLNDVLYSITHINNTTYFARIFSPIISVYLGLFYLYCGINNKINSTSKISLFVLFIGLVISIIIMVFIPYNIGGSMSHFVIIMDSVWRVLTPLSVLVSVFLSFVSIFKKSN